MRNSVIQCNINKYNNINNYIATELKLRKYYLSVFSNRVFSFSILNLQHVESKTLSSNNKLLEILSQSIKNKP